MADFFDIAANVVTVPKDGYGTETALNVGPGSLYYKAGSTVSSGSNDGTLTSGSSLSLTGPTSFVAVSQGARLVVSDPQFDEAASLAASVGQPGGVARAGTYGLLANRPTVTAAGDQGTYFATDDNGGTLYQVQSGAWVKTAPRGVELGYAQITANQASLGVSIVDVTGLTVTFTGGSRPVVIEGWVAFVQNTTAGQNVAIYITDNANADVARASGLISSANGYMPLYVRKRLAVVSGTSYTYKLRANVDGGAGTLFASPTYPAHIQVTEV